jgi:hypothetical protein
MEVNDLVLFPMGIGTGTRHHFDVVPVNVFDRRGKRDDVRPNFQNNEFAGSIPARPPSFPAAGISRSTQHPLVPNHFPDPAHQYVMIAAACERLARQIRIGEDAP